MTAGLLLAPRRKDDGGGRRQNGVRKQHGQILAPPPERRQANFGAFPPLLTTLFGQIARITDLAELVVAP